MTYAKAPIIEAVLDIQVEPMRDNAFDLAVAKFAERISPSFPTKQRIHRQGVSVAIEEDGSKAPQVSHQQIREGWRFQARSRVLQVRPAGFSYSHLPPYTTWNNFRPEAEGLWDLFVESFDPKRLSRIGLRYINRINIPGDRFKVEDYFEVYPRLNESLVQNVTQLFMQVGGPLEHLMEGSSHLLNMALLPPAEPAHTSILLDLDVFVEGAKRDLDVRDLWRSFDRLRDIKNQLFESAITNATRALFA